jgi:hypothetical protein
MSTDFSPDGRRQIEELMAEGWSRARAELYVSATTPNLSVRSIPETDVFKWWDDVDDEIRQDKEQAARNGSPASDHPDTG